LKGSWDNLIQSLVSRGILRSPHVIRAMKLVPRFHFLPEEEKPYASIDSPLPIEDGQTVSAPQVDLRDQPARHGIHNE